MLLRLLRANQVVQNAGSHAALTVSDRILFEAKRAKYSVSDTKRQAILDQVDYYIGKLRSLLESCDKMAKASVPTEPRSASKITRLYRAQLQYWKHAERAYRLICKAWKCDCMAWHRASVCLGGLVAKYRDSIHLVFRSHPIEDPTRKTWDEQALEVVAVDEFAEADKHPTGKIAMPAVRFAMAQASEQVSTAQSP